MKQLLPLVQVRCEKPEMIRVTLLAWLLAWVWQEAGVQDLVQQLQRSCGTQEQLQEEFRYVQQQWEQEEARLVQAQSALPPQAQADLASESTYLRSAYPAPCAPSRWVMSCCSIQWMQSVVQGQWSWHRVQEVLPGLVRFFCPSPRRRRSQRFQLEAWVRLRFANPPGFSSLPRTSFP